MLHAATPRLDSDVPVQETILDDDQYGHRAVAEVNGDGYNDIVGLNYGSGNGDLVWYRYPDWTRFVIAQPSLYADYQWYRSDDLAVADIDNDGDDDIAGRVGPNSDAAGPICWWENPLPSGDPSLPGWTRHDIGITDYNKDLGLADYNMDGKIDVAGRENAETHVFIQGGTPLEWTLVMQTSHYHHEGMAIGDLDNDGDIDLALNGFWFENPHPDPITNTWVFHDVDAKWYTQSGYGWQDNNSNIEVADVNGDGKAEFLISQSELPGFPLSIYSAGDPINGPWTEFQLEPVADYYQTLKAADFDNDGDTDIFSGEFPRYPDAAPWNVYIYLNEGNSGSWTRQLLTQDGVYHGSIGDVGSDGDIDLIGTRSYDTAPLFLWENLTADTSVHSLDKWTYIEVDNSRQSWGDFDTPSWVRYFGLAFGDVDGDGNKDIISGRYWYRNPGGGMTGVWTRTDLGLNCDASLFVDVDDDAFADLIASAGTTIYWLEAQDANGTLWTPTAIDTAFPGTDHVNTQGYEIVELIGGGKPELLLHADGVYMYQIPANPSSTAWTRTKIVSNSNGEAIGIGDIDGDGWTDVAVAHSPAESTTCRIKWCKHPGASGGAWAEHFIGYFDGLYPDRVEVGDLNGDGRPDIAVSEEGQVEQPIYQTAWFEAPADPTQDNWTRRTIVTQHTTNAMDAADMDNDGDLDLITGEHRGTEKVAIWASDNAGNFTEYVVPEGRESHLGARAVDLDGDGDYEIVSIAWDDYQYLHLWRNDNVGIIVPPPAENRPPSVSAGSDRLIVAPENSTTLNGSVFDDGLPATGTLTVQWSQVSGPGNVTFGSPDTPGTTAVFSISGAYVVQLSASDGALSASAHATVSFLPASANQVLHWRFDDVSGASATDSSPFGNHGTVSGATWTDGYYGGALTFNGSSDYVAISDIAINGDFPGCTAGQTGDFTLCAWIKRGSSGSRHPVVSKQGDLGSAARGFVFEITDADYLKIELFNGDDSDLNRTDVFSSQQIPTGIWTHVAVTYEYISDGASKVRLYINGVNDGASDMAHGPLQQNSRAFEAGRYYWSNSYSAFWHGEIDDVRVYNVALTATEIARILIGPLVRPDLQDHLLGVDTMTSQQQTEAEINGDSQLDIGDLLEWSRFD
ncbi:VCBS repeat-containing protein [Candidatus Sumerlaeota bacterium]|nr:VCBS repeat-containing protein [Candidatus Sumerlaeota bacterium]